MARDLSDAQRSAVLYRLIAQRWPTDRGAFTVLYEVRNSTGYGGDEGRIDVLIGANWRADGGRRFIGCEVKASRADWLRELRDHGKRVGLEAVCAERWVVAWGGVVRPEELPAGWGLLERRGTILATVRAAPPLARESIPIGFALSVLRQASQAKASAGRPPWGGVHLFRFLGEEVDLDTFAALVREAADAEVRIQAEARRRAEERAKSNDRAVSVLRSVRAALGLPNRWAWEPTDGEAEEVLEAVRLVTRGRAGPAVLRQLESAERLLREARETLTNDPGGPDGGDDEDRVGGRDVERRRRVQEGESGLQALLHDAGRGEEASGPNGVPSNDDGLRPPGEA